MCLTVQMYSSDLLDFVNQRHHKKLINLKKKKEEETERRMLCEDGGRDLSSNVSVGQGMPRNTKD